METRNIGVVVLALALCLGARAALAVDAGELNKGSARFAAQGFPDQDGCGDIFADVAEQVIPSVVSIVSRGKGEAREEDGEGEDRGRGQPDPRGRSREESGLGSGVLIHPKGYVLTNNHVVEGARELKVRLFDDRVFDAEIVGADKLSDVAVIRLKGKTGDFKVMPLGDSDKLRVGEWVVAVGSPYGLSQTVTTGIVSAKGRKHTGISGYEDFIQTDAAINPGNSGGALVNLKGELVGINTAIVSRSGGYQGIGLAIPSNLARQMMEDLIKDGRVTRGWLGISVQTLDETVADALDIKFRKGALVTDVARGGPGDKAGLKRNDLIVEIGNKPVQDADDLVSRVALARPGAELDLTVMRGIKTLELEATIAKREEAAPANPRDGAARGAGPDADEPKAGEPKVGMQVADADAQLRKRFGIDSSPAVVVTAVSSGSRAGRAGIRPGDVILEADNRSIHSTRELLQAVDKGKKQGKVLLRIRRGDGTFYAAIRFA